LASKPRKKKAPTGFSEAQTAFVAAPPSDLAAIYAAYDRKCAFTGVDLTRESVADPIVWLLRVGPGKADLIPATSDAIYAYESGHLAIGPRYNFLADLEVINPEFLETLNPIGRLAVPEKKSLRPSLRALKAHRDKVAAGRFKV
jgi:hypothetical protein